MGDSEGLSRRSLFKAAGGTGVAGAVITGLGAPSPAAARDTAGATAAPAAPLRSRDPHADAVRSAPQVRGTTAPGVRILPIARAKFLAGGRFDLRVEATGVDPETAVIDIRVEGPDGPAPVLNGEPVRSAPAADVLAVTYRGLSYPDAGTFTVRASVTAGDRTTEASVRHKVVTARRRGDKAKNIIFFLGDGMGAAAITGARLLSKGMTEGKYHGRLEMDRLRFRGSIGTSGADGISSDSSNTMSAYMTGHKTSSGAMGVYESSEPDPDAHPRVENMAELLKRSRDMRIGVVTTAAIQDATPAAVYAHTRLRSDFLSITDQALVHTQRPDVLLGGGLASLLPQGQAGSGRQDDRDVVKEFQDLGYTHISTRDELRRLAGSQAPDKLLGLFHHGDLNVYLDRRHAPNPEVLGPWPDQPTLTEMTEVALASLERHDAGFFLLVEGASIDKMEHIMDGTRALYDTIEFDQAIGVARRWAQDRDDTLIVVVADHNHAMSIAGTNDRGRSPGRAGNGVFGDSGFPTYRDADGDGFPDDPDPEISLFFGWSNHPDHSDDFRHNEVPVPPALIDQRGIAVPNPQHDPDGAARTGNLPLNLPVAVHAVEDVPVFAAGPGAHRVNTFLDNTELFFVLMDALGLDART